MPLTKHRHAFRFLRIAGVTLLVIPILAFVAVQFQQQLLRHRAEQLNSDIAYLRDHSGTWSDLQRIQQRWGAYAHYDGTCDQRHCDYVIYLSPPFDFSTLGHSFLPELLIRIYEKLGGRMGWVDADIRLTDNRIWGTRIDIHADTPDGWLLAGGVYLGPRLFTSFGLPFSRGGEETFSSAIARRGYLIPPTNRFPWKWVSLTPSTSKATRDRLSVIHFSCLSSIRPCTSMYELVPNAETQYIADRALESDDYRDRTCQIPLAMYATEADTILRVEVLASRPSDDNLPADDKTYPTTVKIVEKLKGPSPYQIGDAVKIYISTYPGPADPAAANNRLPLSIGSQHILLFREIDASSTFAPPGWQHEPYIEASRCTIVRDTAQNRNEIARGIAADKSDGEEYNPARNNLP